MRLLPGLVLAGLATLACSLGQTVPEKRRFVVTAERGGEVGPTCGGTLLVHRFRVAPLFERKGFTYRTGEESYDTRFYDEFYTPPGVMLRAASFRWVQDAQLFSNVLEPGDPGRPDWVLEARVGNMYADERSDPYVVLEIEFALLDGIDLEVARKRRFGAKTEAAGAAPEQLVNAWGRALADLLTLLERDLREFLASERRCKPGRAGAS